MLGLAAITSSTTFSMAPVSVTCVKPALLDNGLWRIAGFQHDLEHILGDAAGYDVLADQVDQRTKMLGVDRAFRDGFAQAIEGGEEVARHPVGGDWGSRPLATVSKKSAVSLSAVSTPAS